MNFCYELVLLCHRWQFCSKLFNTLSHRWLVFDVGCHHWLFYFVDRYRHLLFSTLDTTMWIQYLLTSPSGEKEEKRIASYELCSDRVSIQTSGNGRRLLLFTFRPINQHGVSLLSAFKGECSSLVCCGGILKSVPSPPNMDRHKYWIHRVSYDR